MYDVKDIAHWFLSMRDDVTNKKLQKLVYYAYAWYLAINNEAGVLVNRICPNDFEAWVHGAVSPKLYAEYSKYGSSHIPMYNGVLPQFSSDELDLLRQVNEVYGIYNGNQLESICHAEIPWRNARGNLPAFAPSHNPISDEDIYKCYAERLN